jgi:catechol 2,3-dioxygenase-like lactoylglutathione lyase family enzyme
MKTVPDARLAFDHMHLVSKDAQAAAAWYVDKVGGEIVESYDFRGAPQIVVAVGDATLIVRGQRTGEQAGPKDGLQWGVDHFAFQVRDDFDGFCDGLAKRGVRFTLEPTTFNPKTRIAFIEAPDSVSVELVHYTN